MAGLTLLELTPVQASLEEAFMALTQDAVEYRAPTHASRDADLDSDGIAA
jgi:ABC-2 type transport system ATP-binding protein